MGEDGKAGKAKTGKERYIKGAVLGEGTFGVVTKAEDTLTQKVVAIKKIRLGQYREGVNFTAIREIKLLQELRHPHVIELVDCFPHKRNLNLVFECCESDLEAVIKDKFIPLGTPEIKSYGHDPAGGGLLPRLLGPAQGSQAQQPSHRPRRRPQARGFRPRARLRLAQP